MYMEQSVYVIAVGWSFIMELLIFYNLGM